MKTNNKRTPDGLHPTLQAALNKYQSLIAHHDAGIDWRAWADHDSVVVEFRKDLAVISARLIFVAQPEHPDKGYCILFVWGTHFEGAVGCAVDQLENRIYLEKHLLNFVTADALDPSHEDPWPPRWLVTSESLFGHRSGSSPYRLMPLEDRWYVVKPDIIACIDVGAPRKGNIGWAVLDGTTRRTGDDVHELVRLLGEVLDSGRTVALGFECPLYLPKRDDPLTITSARPGEGSMSWAASPGATVMATGLTLTNWVLRRLRELAPSTRGTTQWRDFASRHCQLFVWEAFVSTRVGLEIDIGDCKQLSPHESDALRGALAFKAVAHRNDHFPSDLEQEPALSLAGMQLLETGLSEDRTLLSLPCVVVQARRPD